MHRTKTRLAVSQPSHSRNVSTSAGFPLSVDAFRQHLAPKHLSFALCFRFER